MKEFNPNENKQVASGSVSFKFSLTRKTIIALLSSVSLFSSGFYAGFSHAQSPDTEPLPLLRPEASQSSTEPKL